MKNRFIDSLLSFGVASGEVYRDKYFTFDFEGMNIFVDFNPNTFILTNNQEAIDNFQKNGYQNNVSSTSNIIDNFSYVYLNLDAREYSGFIQDYYAAYTTEELPQWMKIWQELFESIEIKQSNIDSLGAYSAEFKFSFKEKDENILYTLFEIVKENYREIIRESNRIL